MITYLQYKALIGIAEKEGTFLVQRVTLRDIAETIETMRQALKDVLEKEPQLQNILKIKALPDWLLEE